jgi:Domain of unknown function (DUF6531)
MWLQCVVGKHRVNGVWIDIDDCTSLLNSRYAKGNSSLVWIYANNTVNSNDEGYRLWKNPAPCVSGFLVHPKNSYIPPMKKGMRYVSGRTCVGDRNIGPPSQCVANPIDALSGNKYQRETDYDIFTRTYNNQSTSSSTLGLRWKGGFDKRIWKVGNSNTSVAVVRETGEEVLFTAIGGNWVAPTDLNNILTEFKDGSGNTTSWTYTLENQTVETYDSVGKLLSAVDANGNLFINLEYALPAGAGGDGNDVTLDRVVDFYNRVLSFSYDADLRLASIVTPDGIISFTYYSTNNLLKTVTYPNNDVETYSYTGGSYAFTPPLDLGKRGGSD